MWQSIIEPVLAAGPWALVALAGVLVIGKVLVAHIAIPGTESKDRAVIIRAIAEMFRWCRRR